MIVPRIQQEAASGSRCVLPYTLTISAASPYAERICRLLAYFLPEAVCSTADDGRIALQIDTALEEEAYRLTVKDGCVAAEASGYAGFRNAMAALSSMVLARGEGYVLQEIAVSDKPAAKFRSVMLDLARGMKDFDTVCADLVLCAKARLNHVHLHLFDSLGSCLQLDSLPEHAIWEGCYSKAQIRTLVELADVLGLELIPEFDMPGHSSTLLSAMPQFRCAIPEGAHRSDWAICPSAAGVDAFYESVIAELAALFPGKYLHVGGDELEFTDVPEIDQLCHWEECETCKAYRSTHGLEDRQAQYYEFMTRIYHMVKAAGKQMIMWSDQLDCAKPIPLPRDILMQFWRVAAPGRGPWVGCSMNAQLAAGFTVINAFYPQTYVDLEEYANAESLQAWHWTAIPESDPQFHDRILGGELCAWEYGNDKEYSHYDRSLPSAIVLFADKLWNGDEPTYSTEYRQALTRTVLGAATPEGMDLFACIGSVLPPRSDRLIYEDRLTASQETLRQLLSQLQMHPSPRAAHYIPCVQEAIKFR